MRHNAIKLTAVLLTFLGGVAAASFLSWTRHIPETAPPDLTFFEPRQSKETIIPASVSPNPVESSKHEAVFGADRLKIVPATIEKKSEQRRYKVEVTYPQIAGSRDLHIRKLNQHIKALVTEQYQWVLSPSRADLKYYRTKWPDVFNSIDLDYEIRLANDNVLSLYFVGYSYGIGAAHAVQFSFSLNYDLTRRQELKLGDLFDRRSKYLEFISSYCIKELSQKSELMFEDALKPQAKNFDSWNITRAGIQFNFDECKVFSCADGEQVVEIPFSALKPLLRSNTDYTDETD